jgi:hypothetical protein
VTDWSTSDILLPVRYLTMPCLFTNTPMGWISDWPSLLARRRILCRSDWTNMRMLDVRDKCYRPSILLILLYPESYHQFFVLGANIVCETEHHRMGVVSDFAF